LVGLRFNPLRCCNPYCPLNMRKHFPKNIFAFIGEGFMQERFTSINIKGTFA